MVHSKPRFGIVTTGIRGSKGVVGQGLLVNHADPLLWPLIVPFPASGMSTSSFCPDDLTCPLYDWGNWSSHRHITSQLYKILTLHISGQVQPFSLSSVGHGIPINHKKLPHPNKSGSNEQSNTSKAFNVFHCLGHQIILVSSRPTRIWL